MNMTVTPGTQAWRKEMRTRGIQIRLAMTTERKQAMDNEISRRLQASFLKVLSDCVVGFCWPHKYEFDQRFFAHKLRAEGARTALPIVEKKGHPLVFRAWWPGVATTRGVFDLPIPIATPRYEPDVVFPPLNAFDSGGFRLGYGGGYFDRTLASIVPRPLAIGIGYEEQMLDTIYPTEYDIPMDFILTEAHLYQRLEDGIVPVPTQFGSKEVRKILQQRNLPREPLDRADTGSQSADPK